MSALIERMARDLRVHLVSEDATTCGAEPGLVTAHGPAVTCAACLVRLP